MDLHAAKGGLAMDVTRHGQRRGLERCGIDMGKFAALMQQQGLALSDGTHRTPYGTLIVKDGKLVTVLSAEMVTA